CSFYENGIAYTDVFFANNVFVEQGYRGDGNPANGNRVYLCYWGNRACSAYLVFHSSELTCSLFCLEFVGHCPAGMMGRHAHLFLQVELVNLYDKAIYLIREVIATSLKIIAEINDFIY